LVELLSISSWFVVFEEHAVYILIVLSLILHDLFDDGHVRQGVSLLSILALLCTLLFLLLFEFFQVSHDRGKSVFILLLSFLVDQVSYLTFEGLGDDVVFEQLERLWV